MRTMHSLSPILTLALLLAVPSSAGALTRAERECQSTIGDEAGRFATAKHEAVVRCENRDLRSGNCNTAQRDSQIARALDRLNRVVTRVCGGIDLAALGFPGSCPDASGSPFTVADLLTCIQDSHMDRIDMAIATEYPDGATDLTGAERRCQRQIGRRGQTFIERKLRARKRCLNRQAAGLIPDTVDCHAEVPPFGPGTGNGSTDRAIAQATTWLTDGLARACGGGLTLENLGFPGMCTDTTGAPFSLADLQACILETHEQKVDELIALQFPAGAPPVGGTPTPVETATPGETATSTETPSPGETATPVETTTPVETASPGETPSPGETATPTETPSPGETATPVETTTPEGSPSPSPTPTEIATESPTPAPTSTPSGELCGNGTLDVGEDCDASASSPDDTCPNAGNGLEVCNPDCTCSCPALIDFEGNSDPALSELDPGWTGIAHDAAIIDRGKLTVAVLTCDNPTRSPTCGECDFAGPVPNPDAGSGDIDNQRCNGDTSVRCTSDADCGGALGTCRFFFGSNLPLSAGGVSTCVVNEVTGMVTGTANIETGESASSVNLISRVFTGIETAQPCPQCNGDTEPNDGLQDGTCLGGTRNGLDCDANGTSATAAFGTTSYDCPPTAGAKIADLPITLDNSTGQEQKTLSADNPFCRALGHTTFKCPCDTCDNPAATPCSTNADCVAVGATVCGGRRCVGGSNNGTPCADNTECPGGLCSQPGATTAANACADAVCTPTDGNEGVCEAGPVDQNCAAPEQFRGCTTNGDCPQTGLCESKNRECFTDNGQVGAAITADGQNDPPVNDVSNPTLASIFCIGPTGSSSVNNVAGLPGAGRLRLNGTARGLPNATP